MLYTTTWTINREICESSGTIYIRGKQPRGLALEKIRRQSNPFHTAPDYLSAVMAALATLGVISQLVLLMISVQSGADASMTFYASMGLVLLCMSVFFGRFFRADLLFARAERQRKEADISEFEVYRLTEYSWPLDTVSAAVCKLDTTVQNKEDSPYNTWIEHELTTHTELGRTIGQFVDKFWRENEFLLNMIRQSNLSGANLLSIMNEMQPSLTQTAQNIHDLLSRAEEPERIKEHRQENIAKRREREKQAEATNAQFTAWQKQTHS